MTIEFGNRLQELRKAHGYSQETLADKLGVSRQAVSKWECGEASPDTDNLIELAKIYEISLDELVNSKTNESHVKITNIKDEDDDDDDDEDEDEDEESEEKDSRKTTTVDILISLITTIAVIVTYILLGTLLGLWAKAWVLFFLIIIVPSLVEAIEKKNMNKFAWPILIAMIYLTLCNWVLNDLWHPLWILFLTIPIYYVLGDLVNKAKQKKERK
ncbi:MAG: helix-turn-helix transcriptional regulator [Bacilli bacterium]|nr:helix-turn-helix transcriptional regulator [Bacilli bacterium]